MTSPIRGASSNNPSQLSPPTLSWSTVGSEGDTCELCRAYIRPNADCFLSIRRAFALQSAGMIEIPPIRVLMCVDCGWTRPYAPVPLPKPTDPTEGQKPPQTGAQAPDDTFPAYHDAGVMGDA